MFTETELVRVAKRENNNRRNYLVINNMQAKHIPTSAKKTVEMFDELAMKVVSSYKSERLLVIGFAETATAIGARLAVKLDCKLMQTTRESIDDVEYLYFTESHSHATEQKVIKNDLDEIFDDIDRIVFAEDEVTTGNTIMKIIEIIKNTYNKKSINFAIASLLNGMAEDSLEKYKVQNIDIHFLVKTDHSKYSDVAEQYICDGKYYTEYSEIADVNEVIADGYVNGRRLTEGSKYQAACNYLWEQIKKEEDFAKENRYLVLGTEECMYPAIFVAEQIELMGFETKCHSTTRSPIAVSSNPKYPLHSRYELRSMYDDSRKTFLYDINSYEQVIIITDAIEKSGNGWKDLCAALAMNGNKNIKLVRWE